MGEDVTEPMNGVLDRLAKVHPRPVGGWSIKRQTFDALHKRGLVARVGIGAYSRRFDMREPLIGLTEKYFEEFGDDNES